MKPSSSAPGAFYSKRRKDAAHVLIYLYSSLAVRRPLRLSVGRNANLVSTIDGRYGRRGTQATADEAL